MEIVDSGRKKLYLLSHNNDNNNVDRPTAIVTIRTVIIKNDDHSTTNNYSDINHDNDWHRHKQRQQQQKCCDGVGEMTLEMLLESRQPKACCQLKTLLENTGGFLEMASVDRCSMVLIHSMWVLPPDWAKICLMLPWRSLDGVNQ